MPSRIRRMNEVASEGVGAGRGTSRQVLTAPGEGAGFHMRRFVMEPGGGMPRHTNTVEHQQLVLRGRAVIGLGEKVHRVQAGDVVHITPGTPHWYRAEGDEPFEFLCVVPDAADHLELLGEEVPASEPGPG